MIIDEYNIDYSIDHWRYGVEISQMKRDIEMLEALGATHIEIDINYDMCLDVRATKRVIENE